MAFNSPFIAENITNLIFINGFFCFFIMFFALDFKNIKGKFYKKIIQAEQRVKHRKEIEKRLHREMELGYDKIKR